MNAQGDKDFEEKLKKANLEKQRLEKENTYLRGLVQANKNWKCVYGNKIEHMAECPMGFPGCSCADDIMCADEQIGKDLRDSRKYKKFYETVKTLQLPDQAEGDEISPEWFLKKVRKLL